MPSLPLPADPALRQQLFQAAVRVITNLRRDQLQSLKFTLGLHPRKHRQDPDVDAAWNLIEPFVDCEPHIQRLTEDDYSQPHVSPTLGSIIRAVEAFRDRLAASMSEKPDTPGPPIGPMLSPARHRPRILEWTSRPTDGPSGELGLRART
jgi:hypothetical protein